jgi:hypothetical protein
MRGLALAAALGMVTAGCSAPLRPRPSAPIAAIGTARGFTVPSDAGDLTPVPAAGARATVVELWASECDACGPGLVAMAAQASRERRGDIAWVLLGVLDEGEPLDRARLALRRWGIERPFLVDRGGGVQRALAIDSLPATAILDGRRVLRWVAPPRASASDVATAARWVASNP